MDSFFADFDNALGLYLGMLVVSAVFYFLLSRASAVAWFDPWVPQQVLAAFASTVVSFMAWFKIVPVNIAIYHWAAMLAFYVAAGASFRVGRSKVKLLSPPYVRKLAALKWNAFAIYAGAQLVAWVATGIPLLLASRLDAFTGGGGLGLLSRATSFLWVVTIYLSMLHIGLRRNRRVRLSDSIIFGFIVLASVLNASKSDILYTIFFALTSDWVCGRIYPDYKKLSISRGTYIKAFLIAGSLLIFPLYMDAQVSGTNPLQQFLVRLLLSGDGYLWFYGDEYLKTVTVSSPTALLFADFLGFTRLVSWNDLPIHPGLQVFRDLFPDSESIRGPNIRVDTFGLLYGSVWAGVLFCVASGALFGFCRSLFFRARSLLTQCVCVYMLMQSPQILVDPVLGVTMFVDALFGAVLLGIISLPISTKGISLRLRRSAPNGAYG